MSFYVGKPSHQSITSLDRTSGTSSNFTVKLPNWNAYNRFDRCCLLKANIPKSFYLIDNLHNTFTMTENGFTRTCTIPVGNYSFQSMRTALLALLNTGSFVYSITANTLTSKYTFTVTNNVGQPTINFGSNRLSDILGFADQMNTFSASTLTSNQVVRFQIATGILVLMDRVENDNVLADIASTIQDNTYITYQATDIAAFGRPISKTTGDVIRITLVDSIDKEEILLNGLDISLTFLFYKANNYDEFKIKSAIIDQMSQIN